MALQWKADGTQACDLSLDSSDVPIRSERSSALEYLVDLSDHGGLVPSLDRLRVPSRLSVFLLNIRTQSQACYKFPLVNSQLQKPTPIICPTPVVVHPFQQWTFLFANSIKHSQR